MRGRQVMAGLCLLVLLTWDSVLAKQLRFPSRLKVRRVKARTVTPQPFLIDWAQFGREAKSLDLSYLPPAQEEEVEVQTDSKAVPVITPIFNIPEVEVPELTVEPVITPIFDNSFNPISPVITNITDLSPDPVSTQSSCRVVTETVEEEVEETQCQLVTTRSCENTIPTEPTDCFTTRDEDCQDETITETQTVCKENIVNVCEDEVQELTKNRCGFVTEEKCEAGYLTELKDECQYETVLETVCSTGYLVAYQDQCNQVDSKQSCKKVPKWPTKQCRKVPRVEGKCRKVPVKRPNNNCSPLQRVVCEEIPYKQLIKKCVYTNRPICTQEPVEVVRNICNTVEKEICTIAVTEDECQPVTENLCRTVLVPRERTVEREICDPAEIEQTLAQFERSNYDSQNYATTF